MHLVLVMFLDIAQIMGLLLLGPKIMIQMQGMMMLK